MRNAMYYDGVRCNSSGDWLLLSKLVVAAFGGFMKRLFAISALLLAFTLPSVAQGIRLSLSDQKRFDSYYSRCQEYRRTNNSSEVVSMEKRMQEDRKSTRLNSSHLVISYAVFCL